MNIMENIYVSTRTTLMRAGASYFNTRLLETESSAYNAVNRLPRGSRNTVARYIIRKSLSERIVEVIVMDSEILKIKFRSKLVFRMDKYKKLTHKLSR